MPPLATSTGVSITNPLVLYRALLATNRISADPAQHRLALHLQTLYNRLKDYEPIAQYGYKLQQLQRTLGSTPANPAPGTNHEAPRQNIFSSIWEEKRRQNADGNLALTRVLTSHEEAMKIDSPHGLLLHGEVGTGKSMLIDLFADCLPTRKKRRWHYNTFMLEVLAKLERLRRSRELIVPTSLGQEQDYSLLWLARELISTSPILFLDEFQLPDRAAAKILTNLMTCFFQLGGVLVATSNRMPEELDKAARMGFAPPPARMGLRGMGLRLAGSGPDKRSEFADFLDLLRARCDVWQMEGTKDYRRSEASSAASSARPSLEELPVSDLASLESLSPGNLGLGWEQSKPSSVNSEAVSIDEVASASAPKFYHLSDDSSSVDFVDSVLNAPSKTIPWKPLTLSVYGRKLNVPRTHSGTCLYTFDELCSNALGPTSVLGPADYATLASTFHTIIVTDVPILSLLQKNEARRLITLLDSLYEARCKLAVSAKADPDNLFFPETLESKNSANGKESVDQDATLAETMSEIYQDTTAPFRPNVSAYAESPGTAAPEEADATHARFAGLFDEDRAEVQKELSRRHDATNVDVGDARMMGRTRAADTTASMNADTETGATAPSGRPAGPDFSRTGAFTGEDERFAFKRAQSRLWELCSARWWAREHEAEMGGDALTSPSWWRPLSSEVRVWEKPRDDSIVTGLGEAARPMAIGEGMGVASDIEEKSDGVLFKHGATSPFRTSAEPPPNMNWTHVWGMMRWGRKAGKWGRGADAYKVEGEETAEDYVQRRAKWREREPKAPWERGQ